MKRHIKYLFLTVVLLNAVGCQKYLETPPDMRANLDSPKKVAELLASAYPKASYIPFAESMSDNAADKGDPAGAGTTINQDPWFFNDVRSRDQDSPDYYWNGCYQAIAAANQALKAITAAPDPQNYTSEKGEALVARAFSHFMLVTFFSRAYDPLTAASDPGIPYVTEPEENVLKKYERKTVAYVYEMIQKDLEEGLPLIDDHRYTVPKYHFTTAAAHAFATRFYLFKQNYQQAVDHANASVAGGDLSNYLRQINTQAFISLEYATKEAFYTQTDNPANFLMAETVTNWGQEFPGYRYGLDFDLMNELFFSDNVTTGAYAYTVYGTDLVKNIPKFTAHFVKTSINADYGINYNMIPLLTGDELILNRAEAYANLGEYDKAIADLTTFSSTKVYYSQDLPIYLESLFGVTAAKLASFYKKSTKENIVSAVLDFKRREFIFEGLRWLDVVRHKIPVRHVTADRKTTILIGPNDPRRMLQLPQEVILSGVEANPR
ncbi:SusD family protein [bacterium A37T11]|nr:SusD family protein [bacterium A37T11]